MTTIWFYEDLEVDEGFRETAYPDPESPLAKALALPAAERCAGWALLSGDPWTCGYGLTGPTIGPHTIMSQAEAYAGMMAKGTQLMTELDAKLPWWRRLSDPRQDVIGNLTYNMGVPHLLGFKHMLAALQLQDWATAKAQLLDSDAARMLPRRYGRLSDQLESGVRIRAT